MEMEALGGASWHRRGRPVCALRNPAAQYTTTSISSTRRPRTSFHPPSAMASDMTAQEPTAAHGRQHFVRSVLCNGIDGRINALDAQATTTELPRNSTAERAEEEETPALPPRLDSRTDATVEPSAERGHETPAPAENEHPQVALLRGMFPDFDTMVLYVSFSRQLPATY